MGFYGNITNTNKTSLVFDRIYPNRVEMDNNATSDGIFIGRYVLVDYDKEKGEPSEKYARVYQFEYDNYFYLANEQDSDYRAKFVDEPYYLENGEINPNYNKEDYEYCVFKNQVVYTFNEKVNSYTYYKAVGKNSWNDYAVFEQIATPIDSNIYFENYVIDKRAYPDMGRGYDSTVWQKVYADNQEKYVMLAELNSVVPTFDVTVDAPTINPIKPHFDADTTDIYYKLHVQPTWGFRIADIEELDKDYLSDETSSSHEYIWDPILKQRIPVGKSNYNGAIYYNKDGFDAENRYEKYQPENIVSIGPTGISGQEYNEHKIWQENGPIGTTYKAKDIQEFVFQLPAIGNTISQIWDLIYGEGELIDDTPELKKYRRNQNIDWNNITGLRLVQQKTDGTGFEYNTEKVETLAGCINSIHDLMGMIITQEEKLEEETEEEFYERIHNVDNALINRIYYGNYDTEHPEYKGYFIKELTYDIQPGDIKEIIVDNLHEFTEQDYYYKDNSNYYLETSKYQSGSNYYDISINPNSDFSEEYDINSKPLYEKDYEPSVYYYTDNSGNFILSEAKWPNEDYDYYFVNDEVEPQVIVDSKQFFFFPTTEEYYNNANFILPFKSKKYEELEDYEDNGVMKKRGSGWFYLDTDSALYRPVELGLSYRPELIYFTNYLVERGLDAITGKEAFTYEFDKGAEKAIYQMVEFKPNSFFHLVYDTDEEGNIIEEDGDWILLQSEADIDSNNTYQSFPQDETKFTKIELDFYKPDLYYYKEGNDYILARENKKQLDREYYEIKKGLEPVDYIFYEPNKYYYWDDTKNDYVLDSRKTLTPNTTYYKEGVHLYVVSDTEGILRPGSKWNIAIKDTPDNIALGPRKEIYKWKELTGFSRTLNTIHGLILELNRIIKFEDELTRDTNTIQGCINTIKDIIANFGRLIPGEMVIIDNYGRITSSPYTTEQKVESNRIVYEYKEDKFVELKNTVDEKEGWIGLDVNEDKDELLVSFTHKYNPVHSNELTTDMNDRGDFFGVVRPVLDNTGHVIGLDKENIKLPNGYKDIKTAKGDVISAQHSKDGVIVDTDKWLSVHAKHDEFKNSLFFINHEYPAYQNDTTSKSDVNGKGDTIVLETIKVDDKGHVINKNQETITLPFGYKSFSDKTNTSTAQNSQDTFIFAGDNWIQHTISQGQIDVNHIGPVKVADLPADLETPLAFGDKFTIIDSYYDTKGHIYGTANRSFTIPQGSLTPGSTKEATANILTSLDFVPETGAISYEQTNLGDLLLIGYSKQTDGSAIGATDSLKIGLSKLENQIDNLSKITSDNLSQVQIDFTEQIESTNERISDFINNTYTPFETKYNLFVENYEEWQDEIIELDIANRLKNLEEYDKEVEEKLIDLDTAVLTNGSNIIDIQQNIGDVQIADLANNIANIQQNIGEVQIVELVNNITSLQEIVAGLQETIQQQAETINNLTNRITALEPPIEEPEPEIPEEPTPEPENPEEGTE